MVLIYESCSSAAHVDGTYTNDFAKGIAGEDFKFRHRTNTFEYHSRTEGVIKSYSSGTWARNGKTIFFDGFDNKNINLLNVESKVEDSQSENINKIVVQYKDDPLDTFTKIEVVLNEGSKVRILGDTAFFIGQGIRTIRVRSFLIHEGLLLATPPRIDTLYSAKIEVIDSDKPKTILLKINLAQNDFYRIGLKDTVVIKNGHTLIWRGKVFKKIT